MYKMLFFSGVDRTLFPGFLKKARNPGKIRKVKTNLIIIDLKTHQPPLSFLLKHAVGWFSIRKPELLNTNPSSLHICKSGSASEYVS